jgi:hypothetical protein
MFGSRQKAVAKKKNNVMESSKLPFQFQDRNWFFSKDHKHSGGTLLARHQLPTGAMKNAEPLYNGRNNQELSITSESAVPSRSRGR